MNKKTLRTCVTPAGTFRFGVHRPSFTVANLREGEYVAPLGLCVDGTVPDNRRNFPAAQVEEPAADWIYEIPNPFPFRGATFITRSWAESKVDHPEAIALPAPDHLSMNQLLSQWLGNDLDSTQRASLFADLPHAVRMALASYSTDPNDLILLAEQSCHLLFDPESGKPCGLRFRRNQAGTPQAIVQDHTLFEVLVNNPYLPDDYKEAMVLRPGVQGASEIVGEWGGNESHVFEYLRRNSYIPWGHFAANMANDAIRYHVNELTPLDLTALRHLYYQRTFCRLAQDLGLEFPATRRLLTPAELEALRQSINQQVAGCGADTLPFTSTLWGWNYGFDCAANGYRLHASHQMIHQQFAMVPALLPETEPMSDPYRPYSCGDLIHEFITDYAAHSGSSFFADYLTAIHNNSRVDGRADREASLIVHADQHVILFVPKAQISQWELQLMTVLPVGNILEADPETRHALDQAILIAMQTLTALGARMITTIEYSKRFGVTSDQHLLYSFLPKLPFAPGAFSEAQLRFICGHYPEDFARACRSAREKVYRGQKRG